jgi:uncharacterized repeat protein (TIGR03803 family)
MALSSAQRWPVHSLTYAGLVLGRDGYFYGSTERGGEDNLGTIFRMTPNGVLTMLFSFSGTDGKYPKERLIEGNDGNFYGTTYQGELIGGSALIWIPLFTTRHLQQT